MKFTDLQIEFLLTKMSLNDIEEFKSFVSSKPVIMCSSVKKNGSPCKNKVKENGLLCGIHKKQIEKELSKKRDPNKASIFNVKLIDANSEWAEWEDFDVDVAKFMNKNNDKIIGDLSEIKRGDIIVIKKINGINMLNDMNDGKLIWDGKKFMELEFEYHEKGSVSKEFLTFDEFPVGYWYQVIEHISIILVSPKRLKYLKKDKSEYDTNLYIYELTGNDNKTYKVACEEEKLELDKMDVVPMEERDDYDNIDFVIGSHLSY